MKKIKQLIQTTWILMLCILGHTSATFAQCVEALGSSPNVFTSYNANANQIIVNNDLNAVIFIHRNNPSAFPGIDNGVYRYDISTDNGATWQLDQGALNPGSTLGVNGARYPQVGIYNPEGNKVLSNASLVYHGPTTDGFDWNGYVTGSLLLDGAATATENYNQAGVSNTLIPGGFCQGAPGTFWAVDQIYDELTGISSGLRVLKGTYAAGDVSWSVNAEFTPDFNIDIYGSPTIQSVNMAFDPTGVNGWIVFMSHLNGLADYNYHPVFYNTTDGGATWNGPVQLDLTSFASITSLFTTPAAGFEVDIEVDMNGHPHALAYVSESAGFPYGISTTTGQLYDFNYDGVSWNATSITTVSYANRPQVSRCADGTKMVFTWVESDLPNTIGYAPNLKAVTYDVPTGNISCPVNYASICPSIMDGQMYQTTVSPNMIEGGGSYTVPVVLTITDVSGDQNAPVQHYYLNDLSFTDADFSNVATPSTLTITPNGQLPFCSPGSVDLTASSASSYLWNTGETTQTITATGGFYWVIDPSESQCVSDNSIYVESISTPEIYAFSNPVLCPGTTVDLYAYYYSAGNSILWSNGETTQIITVSTPGLYSVTVDGCTSSYAVDVTAGSTPANDNLCNAQPLTVGVASSFDSNCATAEPNEPVPPTLAFYDPASQDGWADEYGFPIVSNSVWFSFIAPQTGAVNITTDGFDTQLALYRSSNYSCTGSLTLIAANEDGGIFGGSFINRAFCLEKGKRYFVQVDGWYGQTGYGTILVTAVPNTVTICHNDANNPVTLTISGCALAAHLAHGDLIGACPPPVRVRATDEEDISAISLNVYPNPSTGNMNVSFESDSEETYTMQVVDLAGRVILSETKIAIVGENEQSLNLQSVTPGLYFLTISKGENVMQTRIVKQ